MPCAHPGHAAYVIWVISDLTPDPTIGPMETSGFRKLRTAVQENGHPAESLLVRQLQRSLEAAFERSGLFSEFELGHTDDPDRMVIGVCRCASDVLPWEAGAGVERMWKTAVLDAEWESHAVSCSDALMEFEAAVTVDGNGHYVTVTIVAEPATVVADTRDDAGSDQHAPIG